MKKKVDKKNLLLWVVMVVYGLTVAIIIPTYPDIFQPRKPLTILVVGIMGLLIFLCILSESKRIHGSTKINKKVFFSAVYFFIVLILVISLTKI
ncbi:hypothetical protein [Alkalihalobacillus sp. LMS39]|uniref:hypothetical protein n=1 Tax=Alkalihalobacillus sp. LMS39 TaxID=2924032 RepID=UPI001FB322B3|nr:hypothetical protein [Alkalihalobacillus sp. LMS39]UOE92253.1 hypothetical protein MM271_13390 [Alkalihalobacillus sp. LMS39]